MDRKKPDTPRRYLPARELTDKIIGCFFSTYNILDFGLLESVYRRALAIELTAAGLHVRQEVPVEARYRGEPVGHFRIDLLVDEAVVVELKATSTLGPTDRRQLLTYLRASSLDVGLLLHFGPEPKFYRIVSPRVLDRPD